MEDSLANKIAELIVKLAEAESKKAALERIVKRIPPPDRLREYALILVHGRPAMALELRLLADEMENATPKMHFDRGPLYPGSIFS